MPIQIPDPASDGVLSAGPACERSALPPGLRLAITFGVLFALRWSLPLFGVPPVYQVLALLVAATFFTWRFWWNCGADRRGPLFLIGSLWIAGAAKLLLM